MIETEAQAFKRQERPSGDLLSGEQWENRSGRCEVQTRRLIEVDDAKGSRTLLETEVIKTVQEITEVSSKVKVEFSR